MLAGDEKGTGSTYFSMGSNKEGCAKEGGSFYKEDNHYNQDDEGSGAVNSSHKGSRNENPPGSS
jgi:hypothetical protein